MMQLTPRQRMQIAMSLKTPDRVPVMCQLSIGHMLQQLNISSSEFWFDANSFAKGLVELREMYRFDGILVSLHGHKQNWRDDVLFIEKEGENEILTFKDYRMIFTRDDLPVVTFFNVQNKVKIDEICLDDLPESIDYIPVSQDLHFNIDLNNKLEIFDLIYQSVGEEYSIHGEVTSPFDYLLDLLGYEEALISLIENPDKCKTILKKFTKGIIELSVEMCEKQIDAIKISSPFAGMGFISPTFYKEFVLPYESQIIRVIKENGKFPYIHTCGAITDRLESMEESGASGLECLDPPPLGNVELEDAIQRIGDSMFIKGNIDSVNTLLRWSKMKIIEDVKKRIEIGKTAKGFILSTACSIAPHVHREKVQLLTQLANEYGRY